MEMDVLCRLSMTVGFLSAAVLFLLLAAAVIGAVYCARAAFQYLDRMLSELEIEEGMEHESEH